METTNEYLEPFEVYSNALNYYKKMGLTRVEAKDYAKTKLYDHYPEFSEYGKHPKFWSMVSTELDQVYPKVLVTATASKENESKKVFSFIEFYQYLADKLQRLPDDKLGNKIGEFFDFSDSIAGSTRAGLVTKGYKLTMRVDGGWDVEPPQRTAVLDETRCRIEKLFGGDLSENQIEAISLLISMSLLESRASGSGA